MEQVMPEPKDDTFDLPDELAQDVANVRAQKGVDPTSLTAALMCMDNDVDLPGRSRPASVISNLLALKVGENFTKSFRVPDNLSLADVKDKMNGWKEQLRSSVNQSLRHARSHGNRKFTTESVQAVSPSGSIYLQVIVTRTE